MTMIKQSKKIFVKLTKKQKEFNKAFEDRNIKEILVGWWARWGKTWWVCEIINITILKYPGIVWLIWRNEWDDLRKTTLNTLLKVFKVKWMLEWDHYKVNYQTKEIQIYNWSKILFVPLKQQPSDPEFNWLGGYEITFFFIDEAQEVSPKCLSIIKSRCTEKIQEYNLVGKWFLWCNPLKWWLYDRYIKPRQEGKLKENKAFIQSLYLDNPFINHLEYENSLADSDEVTKDRLLRWNRDYDSTPWKLYLYDVILDLFKDKDNSDYDKPDQYYISIDWATEWKDKAVLLVWKWLDIIEAVVWDKCTTEDIKNKALEYMIKYQISTRNVVNDHVWVGAWISYWIGNWVYKFNSNSSEVKIKQSDPQLYNRLRDQCYYILKKYINKINIKAPTLVNEEKYKAKIIRELDVISQVDIDKDGPIKIIKKENIKKAIGNSPDFADAISMRMVRELKKRDRKKPFYYIPGQNQETTT